MSWFKKLAKKVVKSKAGKVMDTFSAAFSNPVGTVKAITTKKTFQDVTREHFEKPLSTQISKTVTSAVIYGTAVYGAGAIATKGIVSASASLIPSTLKGKAIGFVATPLIAGAVIKKPELITQAQELPATAFKAGTIIGDPSIKKVTEFVKEHPIATAAGAAAAAGTVGYAGVTAAKILTTGKEKASEVIKKIKDTPQPDKQLAKEKPLGVEGEVPLTPSTQTITTGIRRYKRRRAKKTQSVRQSVRVNIINKPRATGMRVTNKRYINQQLLN